MIKKIQNYIHKKNLFYGIFFFLLVIPFFWFPNDLYILGEDDTGLMYYNTMGTFKESLSAWFSADHIGRFEESAGHFLIFNLLLLTFKAVTFGLVNVQQLIYGLLISFSYVYIVKILEFLTAKKSISFIVAALFYTLSPYFIMVEYYYLMPSTFAILLCPALTYHLLYAIHKNSWQHLIGGALWSFILSRVLITPTFLNFFGFLFLFIILYSVFVKKIKLLQSLKYFLLYCVLILSINAHMVIPYAYTIFESDSSALKQSIDDRSRPVYLDNMIYYIQQEIELNRVTYYLMNIFPEPISALQGFRTLDFYNFFLNHTAILMFFVTLCTFSGLIVAVKKRDTIVFPLLTMFLLTLTFLTVNIFNFTERIYYFLMYNTPIFNMNRIPSMKFHIPFIFYYSLLVGISVSYLISALKPKLRNVVITGCLAAILINSFLFWSGTIFTLKIPHLYTVRAMDFNKNYIELVQETKKHVVDDSQFLLFPLGYGFGSFIMGRDDSQFYRSTITGFKSFTGYNMFGNLRVIGSVLDPTIYTDVQQYYFKNNINKLLEIGRKLNIKYVLLTKKTDSLRQFAELIPEHTYDNPHYLKPLNTTEPVYENDGYAIYKLKNYDSISHFTTSNPDTKLAFTKVSDFLYLLKINTQKNDHLIFNESFSHNWNLYELKPDQFNCINARNFAREFPNIQECIHINDNVLGNKMLLQMYSLPKLDNNQMIYDDFANSWEIDTNGKDLYVAVLFEGQKYYQLGILVSSIVFLSYILIILFYAKKRTYTA